MCMSHDSVVCKVKQLHGNSVAFSNSASVFGISFLVFFWNADFCECFVNMAPVQL
jgi:hypothetical protein